MIKVFEPGPSIETVPTLSGSLIIYFNLYLFNIIISLKSQENEYISTEREESHFCSFVLKKTLATFQDI